MEDWKFCWETQVGDAFPVLRGGTEGHMCAEVRQTWVKLSASEGKLDKLRPDSIHVKRDGTGRITNSVIFEITRANDLFAKFWGDKVAQKTLR